MAEQTNSVGRGDDVSSEATRALHAPAAKTVPVSIGSSIEDETARPVTLISRPPLVAIGDFAVDQPLARHYPIPTEIARLVLDADRDIARGRLESALDLTLAAQSERPDCLGLYVRLAELLLATGRPESAENIVGAIARARGVLEGPSVDVEMEQILTHADPTDANILHLAQTLLDAGRAELIDRYLPIAIEAATLQDDPRLTLDLAQHWREIRPESLDAAFCVTREALRAGEKLDWERVSAQLPGAGTDPRALVMQMVIECADQNQSQWDVTARLLAAIESRQIDSSHVQNLMREMIAVQPANESLLVHSGVLEINSGNPEAAFQLLSSVRPADPLAYYVATVACARAAHAAGDSLAAVDTLHRAIELYEKPEIAEFADKCSVLRAPHDMFSTGKSVAGSLQQQGDAALAATLLERLSTLSPNREDLSRAYADALAKSGKREIAVARLEEMLQTHESRGNSEGVLLTIQSILQIAPGNLRLRGRLIDEFMKRGKLHEAVQERWTQAQILERAGRIDDAVDQLRRALDMASMLGDWKKLENVVRMMIRIRPDDLDVRHSAATKFIEYGQIQLAIEQLWAAVGIANTLDDPDEAIAALHQIIALGPLQTDAYHKLGEVLAAVGEYAQAERVYRRLSTLVPDDPAIQAKQSALAAMANGPD